jgi:hypothetical protein
MLGATHLIAGAAVYSTVRWKPLGLAAALASHYVLDAIPHYELMMRWNLLLGGAAGLFLLFLTWQKKDPWLLVAGILGGYPDFNWLLRLSDTMDRFHNRVHYSATSLPIWAMVVIETIALALCVTAVVKYSRRRIL